MSGRLVGRMVLVGLLVGWAASAAATCVDINADPPERLAVIRHIDAARAAAIVAGRPWPAVAALTAIHGIGRGRIRDILEDGVACVGARAAPGLRPVIAGKATVVDADTLRVAELRVRLIGIDAPEREQICAAPAGDWPCGAQATAAMRDLVGELPVACEVHGHDWRGRALAVCRQGAVDLNAEIVRQGWALAWYPESGAVLGPSYAAEQAEAVLKAAGIWQGEFVEPWVLRRAAP